MNNENNFNQIQYCHLKEKIQECRSDSKPEQVITYVENAIYAYIKINNGYGNITNRVYISHSTSDCNGEACPYCDLADKAFDSLFERIDLYPNRDNLKRCSIKYEDLRNLSENNNEFGSSRQIYQRGHYSTSEPTIYLHFFMQERYAFSASEYGDGIYRIYNTDIPNVTCDTPYVDLTSSIFMRNFNKIGDVIMTENTRFKTYILTAKDDYKRLIVLEVPEKQSEKLCTSLKLYSRCRNDMEYECTLILTRNSLSTAFNDLYNMDISTETILHIISDSNGFGISDINISKPNEWACSIDAISNSEGYVCTLPFDKIGLFIYSNNNRALFKIYYISSMLKLISETLCETKGKSKEPDLLNSIKETSEKE